jgi:hypothetical protein
MRPAAADSVSQYKGQRMYETPPKMDLYAFTQEQLHRFEWWTMRLDWGGASFMKTNCGVRPATARASREPPHGSNLLWQECEKLAD